LLAVAADLAGREGLPDPVAITARFQAEETNEADWQQLVLSHLKTADWIRVEIADELDLLGPAGSGFLSRHGLRYPQNTHFQDPLLRRAVGGSLLSGAGGDELFEPHRWARAALVVARSVPIRRSDALVVGAALSPGPIRARVHYRGQLVMPGWLRPAGRRKLSRRVRRWVSEDRVRYDAHLEWWRRSRYLNHGQRSLQLLAEDHDVQFLAPFSEDRVLRALAIELGRTGFTSRSSAMDRLFGELLPTAIIERQSKATFLNPMVGPLTRAFAEVAEPDAVVSDEWVDTVALRSAWREEQVDVRSLPALQLCWLAQHRSGDN
jgi:asparagine synthase (glutamine-hydrolysing)